MTSHEPFKYSAILLRIITFHLNETPSLFFCWPTAKTRSVASFVKYPSLELISLPQPFLRSLNLLLVIISMIFSSHVDFYSECTSRMANQPAGTHILASQSGKIIECLHSIGSKRYVTPETLSSRLLIWYLDKSYFHYPIRLRKFPFHYYLHYHRPSMSFRPRRWERPHILLLCLNFFQNLIIIMLSY